MAKSERPPTIRVTMVNGEWVAGLAGPLGKRDRERGLDTRLRTRSGLGSEEAATHLAGRLGLSEWRVEGD